MVSIISTSIIRALFALNSVILLFFSEVLSSVQFKWRKDSLARLVSILVKYKGLSLCGYRVLNQRPLNDP